MKMEHTHNEQFVWYMACSSIEFGNSWLTSLNLLLKRGEKGFFFIFTCFPHSFNFICSFFWFKNCVPSPAFPLLWFKPKVTIVSAKKVILFSCLFKLYSFELNPGQLLLVFFLMVKVNFLLLFSHILLETKVDSNDFIGSVLLIFSVIQILFYIL